MVLDPPQVSLGEKNLLEEAGVVAFLPLEVAVDHAQRPMGGGWAAPQLAPSELGGQIPRPAWTWSLGPPAQGGARGLSCCRGPMGVVRLAITEKKARLLFTSCVQKSL